MKKTFLFASVFVLTVLTAVLLFVLPASAASGTWGDLEWTLNETTGELTISGEGEMIPFGDYTDDAWHAYRANILSVTIGDGVTSIGHAAFSSCWSLTSITIGNSVTSIGERVFRDCSQLMSLDVSPDNPNYSSIDGDLYSKDQTTLVQYAIGKVERSFAIPDSVTSIGEHAFWTCWNLEIVTIPDSVTSISDGAFRYCGCLMSIDVSPDNPNYSSIDGSLYSKDETTLIQYALGKIDTSFVMPNSVTSIRPYALDGCRNLTYNVYDNAYYLGSDENPYIVLIEATSRSITSCQIHSNTRVIYESAFYACSSLTSITIPISITRIGDFAFAACVGLKNAKYDGTQEQWNLIEIGIFNEDLINAVKGDDKEGGDKNTDGGCGSVVSGGLSMMALIALAGGMVAVKKRK